MTHMCAIILIACGIHLYAVIYVYKYIDRVIEVMMVEME